MITAWFRKAFRWILEPVTALLAKLGVSANALTLFGSLLNVGVAVIIATGRLQLGGILLVIAAGFDAADGTLARRTNHATHFGAFLDSVMDRVSESAVLLGIAWWTMAQGNQVATILTYVSIVGSLLVSYTRARAEGIGAECKVGLFTRVERCVLIVLGLISKLVVPLVWVLAIGTTLTVIHRMWHVWTTVGKAESAAIGQ